MPKRLTTNEFILRAIAVHGLRYDYSEAIYIKTDVKLAIICKEHGPFPQTPNNHLSGHGCPDCALDVKSKKLRKPQSIFIRNARSAHGTKYEYAKVIYKNARSPIVITCPLHGDFEQTPDGHLQGHGCPKCGGTARSTTEEFILEARRIHGNRYEYARTTYVNAFTHVTITCPVHGDFPQAPASHKSGQGCPSCAIKTRADKLRYSTKQFIEGARVVHGDKYDYSATHYVDDTTKLVVICTDHGPWSVLPANHTLRASGCPVCGTESSAEKTRKTVYEFIADAVATHGTKYDYSLVKYKNSHTPVDIICEKHGVFPQAPTTHIHRYGGCPRCNSSRGQERIRAWLESNRIHFEEEKRFKKCRLDRALPFDFFVPSLSLLIEFDGPQHFQPIEFFGGEKQFKMQQQRDQIKTNFASQSGLALIRIAFWQDIEQELTERFGDFDLECPPC